MKGNQKAEKVDNDIKNHVKETCNDTEHNDKVNDDKRIIISTCPK